MLSAIFLFCPCFFLFLSLKQMVQSPFVFLKLMNLMTSDPAKAPILLITIVFYFLKFSVIGFGNNGFLFFLSAEFLHRVLVFMIIHTAYLILDQIFGNKIRLVHLITDSLFVKVMVTSGLNSFDITTINVFANNYMSEKNPKYFTFLAIMLMFGCAGLLNRFFTVYSMNNWRKGSLFRSEANVYMLTYLVISLAHIIIPLIPCSLLLPYSCRILTQGVTIISVFSMSVHNMNRGKSSVENKGQEQGKTNEIEKVEAKAKEEVKQFKKEIHTNVSYCLSDSEIMQNNISMAILSSNVSTESNLSTTMNSSCWIHGWEEYRQVCNENTKDMGPQ